MSPSPWLRRVLPAVLALVLTTPALAQRADIVELQGQVSQTRLLDAIAWLESHADPDPTDGVAEGTRFVGSAKADSIPYALRDSLASFGWDVGLEPFTIQHDTLGTVQCYNVIARRDGRNADATIVLGAHWDSINSHSTPSSWDDPQAPAPSANDNGSGVATVLEIARLLGQRPFRQDVEICFFGGEELWMKGSRHHVQNLLNAGINVAGYFNVDMVGYDADAWDFKLFYDPQSTWFRNLVLGWLGQYTSMFWEAEQVGSSWSNSDLYPFWTNGMPAVGFWEGNDHAPEYDNCCDTIANNYSGPNDGSFLAEMCRTILACFCEWADVQAGTAVDFLPADGLALNAWPNPFRASGGATLSLSARAGSASASQPVQIFDVAGRQLRSLRLDGAGQALWDGRDDSGTALPTGVYFARALALPDAPTRRIVLLR